MRGGSNPSLPTRIFFERRSWFDKQASAGRRAQLPVCTGIRPSTGIMCLSPVAVSHTAEGGISWYVARVCLPKS